VVSQAGPQLLAFTFPGYVKAGDALTITFDKAVTKLRQMDVKTWLEKPEEPATLRVVMHSMPVASASGQHRAEHPGSKIEVRITKSTIRSWRGSAAWFDRDLASPSDKEGLVL